MPNNFKVLEAIKPNVSVVIKSDKATINIIISFLLV
jgi:hypothetical protein